MRALVVGYGSIGARHARLLTELGCQAAVVSGREIEFPKVFSSMADAIGTAHPDYVVIANSTDQHFHTLLTLAQLGYAGTVLVEKPIFDRWRELPSSTFKKVFVGYNLRFHPVIQRLKTLLEGESLLSAQAYAGQYLPEWRPTSDYRRSYSASKERGGGVLRDLSHELDFLTWLLGRWERVSALGGHLSPLEITSDDVFSLMLVTQACPIVTLQMNYLDRLSRRFVIINTASHTIEADLIKGIITVDRDRESYSVSRNCSYRAMHQAIISDNVDDLCTLRQGLDTLRLIEASELAVVRQEWVMR